MKPTVEIPGSSFRAAKQFCAEHGITLRQLIRAGLRTAIGKPKRNARFRIQRFGSAGEGQTEFDRERIREMIHSGMEGSGGMG